MRTNIQIDDKLMDKAKRLTGLKTKKEIVEHGIKLIIQLKEQEKIKSAFGKLKWEGNLEKLRSDK